MIRLLKYADALSESFNLVEDENGDLVYSFADIVEAIHIVQDEMGIAGATAAEATTTIEGSISMMKASWENLVVGMADSNADMDTLINNFVDSTATAAENLIPRIEQTLSGIGTLIEELSPIIAEALPTLVESLLPTIITSGISLITALANAIVQALPAIQTALYEGLVIILTDVFGKSESEAWGFVKGLNEAFYNIADGFKAMVESAQTDGTFLNEVWTGLQETGQAFVNYCVALWESLSAAFSWLVTEVQTEGTVLNQVWEHIQTAVKGAITFIQGLIETFTAVLKGDWESAWNAVEDMTQGVSDTIGGIVAGILTLITGFLGEMVAKGTELIASLAEGIENKFAELMTSVGGWVTDNIINPIVDMGTDLYNAGVTLLNEFWDGLKSVWNSVSSWWNGLTFSKKTAEVDVETNGADVKGYATGLNYVPYDDFPALLHRGEAVLTAAEAKVWRSGGYNATPAMAGVTINQYIQSVPQTAVDFANTTEAYFEQARWML